MTKSDKEAPNGTKPSAGKVRHDERGHAVWQWAHDTARNALTSASQMLKKLDLSGLSLEEDPPSKPDAAKIAAGAPNKNPAQAAKDARAPGGGFNPYEDAEKRGEDPRVAPRARPGATPPARASATAAARPSAARDAAASSASSRPKQSPPASAPPRSSWWRRLFRRD